jgi:hypothetical protein
LKSEELVSEAADVGLLTRRWETNDTSLNSLEDGGWKNLAAAMVMLGEELLRGGKWVDYLCIYLVDLRAS